MNNWNMAAVGAELIEILADSIAATRINVGSMGALKAHIDKEELRIKSGPIDSFAGVPIFEDKALPADVLEVRLKVNGRDQIKRYRIPEPTE